MPLTFLLPMPPSINKTMRSKVNWKAQVLYKPGAVDKNQYKQDVYLYCAAMGYLGQELSGDLGIKITYVWPSKHRMDMDNGQKTLKDAIAEAVGFNDRRIIQAIINVDYNHKGARPHVEVSIWELDYEDEPDWPGKIGEER